MRAWVNGRILESIDEAAITVTDHGFTVGDGVFEAVKVVDGVPFALSRHLARLSRSAAALGLPPVDEQLVRRAVAESMAGQDLPLGRLRITWTGGVAPMGSNRGEAPPTLTCVAGAMAPYPETAAAVSVPWPRNERGALAGVKSTSYAENVVALAHAAERSADEALFANTLGNICEGTGSNIFYVVDGELRTPTLASGCLAGVTRALVLEWFGGREVDEPMAALEAASEAFLVSTTRDVQGIHSLDGRRLPAPGPVTREAARTWALREAEQPDP
ncbi:aminotransferase class IV [Nocardioides sp. AE5]|uniref:aminotransferase class IV n=1 Tax=Nocardioides sp. AE5 TaxID=2962573 RepID=UPI0028822422|nr:aminotransferase class IV [Nocardioides sp. AE5]MDT0203377.1 aminotransferase class IV [Nocardioides sp. AE5]